MSEVFNCVLKGAHCLPITALVQLTFFRVNSYFVARREQGANRLTSDEQYTPYVDAQIKACVVKAGSMKIVLYDHCDAPNPGVPLTTCQPVEFLWILGDLIPHCCIPFIGIHIFTKKNCAKSPLFRKLYPTYNLYNNIIITHPGSQQK